MLFTIVTVVLDEYAELLKTFDSILIQQYDNIEWVVIHGGSDSLIPEFLVESQKHINIKCLSESDEGIYDAMNKGVSIASGMYLVFLNAGDVLHDEFVMEKIFKQVTANNFFPDIVFGAAELLFSNGKKIIRPAKLMDDYIWHGLPANHQATYYKKASIPLPPYDLKYKMCGDYYIVANMYLNKIKALMMNDILVDFSIGGTSYHNPYLLIKEAYMIQARVLNVPFHRRLLSACRRFLATVAVVLIENIPRPRNVKGK